jgi:hypothetical protein
MDELKEKREKKKQLQGTKFGSMMKMEDAIS